MFKIKKTNIMITRGDSAYISINIMNGNGIPYKPLEGDKIYAQVRYTPTTGAIIFDAVLEDLEDDGYGSVVWHILPENTAALSPGTYYWDAQLVMENGDTFSFIPVSQFVVTDEVTQ